MSAYFRIQNSLQASDLTINFKSETMFWKPCEYKSYRQAYDIQSEARGRGVLPKTWGKDQAVTRVKADDKVTFSSGWNDKAGALPNRKDTPGVAHLRAGAGITRERIKNQMAFGQHQKTGMDTNLFSDDFGKKNEIKSTNPHFNPKTKQIFAALNYGRCPQGGTTEYGKSFFVLNPKFKMNALYFAGDTYLACKQSQDQAIPYSHLGAIVARAPGSWGGMSHLIQACYYNQIAMSPPEMIEAHIFSDLPFKNNIDQIHLMAKVGSPVYKNAKAFAQSIGAKLVLLAPGLDNNTLMWNDFSDG